MNNEHKRLVDRLESSGQDLVLYLGRFSEHDLFESPGPSEWSIHQVMAHMRDAEEQAFLFRMKKMLSEDNPAVPNFNQEAWQREHYSTAEPLEKILGEFRVARRKQVALLRKTTDKQWSRTARHPEFGTISLDWLVSHNVSHTFEHLAHVSSKYESKLLKSLNG
jgi:DinB family protein